MRNRRGGIVAGPLLVMQTLSTLPSADRDGRDGEQEVVGGMPIFKITWWQREVKVPRHTQDKRQVHSWYSDSHKAPYRTKNSDDVTAAVIFINLPGN